MGRGIMSVPALHPGCLISEKFALRELNFGSFPRRGQRKQLIYK